MDQLLLVPVKQSVPQDFLDSLRESGWRITVTSDMVRAKQLLLKGDISALMIEFSSSNSDPDRFKVLRFVHEFCPTIQVMMMHSGADTFGAATQTLLQDLETASAEPIAAPSHHAALDVYDLTPAQKRMAQLVAQAYPNREIARRLNIKEQSVRNEISRIFKKIGVWNRVELALLVRNGHNQTDLKAHTPETISTPGAWTAEFARQMEKSAALTRANSGNAII